ncbi:MAG TPA: trehalose-6-phosphate synthase [Acidimicrobiales bacterium]|nr:trehalose-6-phosphate synthase [Acidimicrobiales bacterium]
MGGADLVIASNRGPLSFVLDGSGGPVAADSAGGLAGALQPLLEGSGATWVACAMSEADRKAADAGLMSLPGLELVVVRPDLVTYRMAYDVVSNSTLWFCHHHLFDLARRPRAGHLWSEAWDAYRSVNAAFASAVADVANDGATVLVQDYHLCLVPEMLARARPDLRTVHFSHTPFADPNLFRVLPAEAGRELLRGMAAAAACGFHTGRWEAAFRGCCADTGIDPGPTFVSPLGPNPPHLGARAASAACRAARADIDELVGDRRLVVRVDRLEPSKNLLRGFWAFDELLETHPEWRGRVVMLALGYASRESLSEYVAYATEVEHAVARVNETWGTPDWRPIVLDVADDPDRSFAALTRYDVLLVNPVRDGLNLVAKEGPLVNDNDGVLALSREAGAFEELRDAALAVNPYDVADTAVVLERALAMPAPERARRAASLRALVERRQAGDWLADLVAAAAP